MRSCVSGSGRSHTISAGEQRLVTVDRVVDQPFVRRHHTRCVIAHEQLHVSADLFVPRTLGAYPEGHGHPIRPQPEPQVVAVTRQRFVEQVLRRPVERRQHLGGRDGQVLSGPDQKGHPSPAPRVEVEAERGIRPGRRSCRDARLLGVAEVLRAHQVRALRRYEELTRSGQAVSPDEVLRALAMRDRQDMERDTAPLRAAEDAVRLDTTDLSIGKSIQTVLKLASERSSTGA